MKKVSLVLLIASLSLYACSNNSNIEQDIKNIPGEAFLDSVQNKQDIQLIDVRTADEFANGSFPGALNIDFNSSDFDNKVAQLDKNKATYVFCLSGGRSTESLEKFRAAGFTKVYALQGGVLALEESVNQQSTSENGIDKAQFEKFIAENKNVIVDFYADWCGPCKMMAPHLETLEKQYGDIVKVLKVNVDASSELAKEMNIGSIPHLKIYKDGKFIDDQLGFDPRDPEGFISDLIKKYQ